MTINELINEVSGAEFNATVKQSIGELASVQAGCGVHTLFRPSCVDLESGRHGLRWLIARILTEAGAYHPKFNGSFRAVYVQTGLTVDEIRSKVRACNGFDKYPDKTINQVLFVVMKRSGQVAKIGRDGAEDSQRPSNFKRPRAVWYLVAE